MTHLYPDKSPGAFVITDKDFKILTVSEDLKRQLGYTEKELYGRQAGMILPHTEGMTVFGGGIAEYLQITGKADVSETMMVRKDKREFPVIVECAKWDDRYILYIKETFGMELDKLNAGLFEKAFMGDSRTMLAEFVVRSLVKVYLISEATIENFFKNRLASAGRNTEEDTLFQFTLMDGYSLKVYLKKSYLTEERLFRLKKLADKLVLAFQLVDQFYKMRLQSTAVESVNNAILITSPSGGLLEWANTAFYNMSGYDESEVIGKSLAFLDSGVQSKAFFNEIKTQVLSGKTWRGEIIEKRKDGGLYPVIQTTIPLTDASGRIVHFLLIHEDLSVIRKMEGTLADFIYYDALTGLPNRKRFEDLLTEGLKKTSDWAVMAFDLVGLNKINDTMGHLAGDLVLKEAARRLLNGARENEIVSRAASDEFLVASASSAPEHLLPTIERYMDMLTQPYVVKGEAVHLGVHGGISLAPRDGENAEQLSNAANIAMHRTEEQANGKSRYFSFYSSELSGEIAERYLLVRDLRLALERDDELFLMYQPQFSIKDERIVSVEGLIRWKHPEKGIVSPGQFIGLAEENDLIIPLGKKVFELLLRDMHHFKQARIELDSIAVNVSTEEFMERDFISRIEQKKDELLYPLELELTESVLMRDPSHMAKLLERLTKLGVKIAIDDFGSGYSSLNYLSHLTVSTLKMDKAFIDDIDERAMNREIVKTIIQLGHSLGLKVLAEGVEDVGQRDFLAEAGCDMIQGYFYARPLMRDDFIDFCVQHKKEGVA